MFIIFSEDDVYKELALLMNDDSELMDSSGVGPSMEKLLLNGMYLNSKSRFLKSIDFPKSFRVAVYKGLPVPTYLLRRAL